WTAARRRRPRARPPPGGRPAPRRCDPGAAPQRGVAGTAARVVVTARSLPERILALERALVAIPHAFGGALALAYYAEPRATIDIDLNVFVHADHFPDVAAPLLDLGVAADDPQAAAAAARDGQARVMWDQTPIDLFFAYDPFHDAAAAARRTVPFADASIPILSPEHLVVCKV